MDVVKEDQQIRVGQKFPLPYYSRVVGVRPLATGLAESNWDVTPPLGNVVWLLGVDIWFDHSTLDPGDLYYDQAVVFQSFISPKTALELSQCEVILPTTKAGIGNCWVNFDRSAHMHFNLRRLFTGGAIRFGLYVTNLEDGILVCQAAFEISEG